MLETNKIYCENCLEGLKKIPDKSINLVFFDPPYNANKDYGIYKDNMLDEEYKYFMKEVILECKRISKNGIGLYCDSWRFKFFWDLIPEAEPIIIQIKANGFKNKYGVRSDHHIILTTAKSNKSISSVWEGIRVLREGYFFREAKFEHPAFTTLVGTKRFIENFSEKDDIVLDCFIGVGTTAVACKELSRNFIGFEINQKYIDIANQRLNQEVLIS